MQALWALMSSLLFASMAVCIKIAGAWFSSSELLFYRGLLGMLFIWGLAHAQGVSLRTGYLGMHAWRSLIGVASMGAWFYAIAALPLATAMTLNYMSSVWVAAFLVGGALLAWNPRTDGPVPMLRQGPLVLTVLAGFAGVVLMLRPTIDQHQMFAGVVGVMSGMTAAFAYMQVMALAKVGEPDLRTVFYFSVGTALAGAGGMAVGDIGSWSGAGGWDWRQALWLLPVGLLASLGQLSMTRAYSKGATLVVANLQYAGIVFAAFYGLLLFGDQITAQGWLGMALIVASGIAATVLRSRAAPNAPGEEH
jgi:drug/metabolite transporter (DMT)-like permease